MYKCLIYYFDNETGKEENYVMEKENKTLKSLRQLCLSLVVVFG